MTHAPIGYNLHYEKFEDGTVREVEVPYELPGGWEWAKLVTLSAAVVVPMADGPFGSNLKSSHYTDKKEVRIIQLSNIGEDGNWKEDNTKYTTFEHLKTIERSEVQSGNLVIAKMMPAGKAIIAPSNEKGYVLSSDAVKLVPNQSINKELLLKFINSNTFRDQVYSEVQGITRARTSLSKLKNYFIPIPPIVEQEKILVALNNYYELVSSIESDQESLQQLANQLKKKVLDVAMQGKLVPQDPNDEPASVLLEKIQVEKQRLFEEGKLKKKDLEETQIVKTDDNAYYEKFPSSWEIEALGNVYLVTSSKRVMKNEWVKDGVPFYRAREIVSLKKGHKIKEPIFISEKTYIDKILVSGKPQHSDILITGVGTLGITYVVPQKHQFYFKDGNVVWLKYICGINSEFIEKIIESPQMKKIINHTKGTTVGTLTIDKTKSLVIPIPPKTEQDRITLKVNTVFEVLQQFY